LRTINNFHLKWSFKPNDIIIKDIGTYIMWVCHWKFLFIPCDGLNWHHWTFTKCFTLMLELITRNRLSGYSRYGAYYNIQHKPPIRTCCLQRYYLIYQIVSTEFASTKIKIFWAKNQTQRKKTKKSKNLNVSHGTASRD